MKTKYFASLAATTLFSIFNFQFSAFSQGSLTPPGPPAPTMVTLSQVAPRTPINTLPSDSQDLYVISQPGSYYLTANITVASGNAISITTNGVTLDLNGFTISSTGSDGTAIWLNLYNSFSSIGNSDITISNGHITGGVTYNAGTYSGNGFLNGISYFEQMPRNVRVTGVSVSGCSNYGIYLGTGNSTLVESCTVNTVGGSGIEASTVSHSTAYQCGYTAIVADTASDCYGYSTGGDGLDANYTTDNCYGESADTSFGSYGIYVGIGNANNCYGYSNGGTGLNAATSAFNCLGLSNGNGIGLDAVNSADNCYGQSNGSGDGLDAENANNCCGSSYSGDGINADISVGCLGASMSGIGLSGYIANSCLGYTVPSETESESVTYKYNMP